MCTRTDLETRALGGSRQAPAPISKRRSRQVEQVALVAQARRELLLRIHAHRLRREDLEDCLSQATLELLARAEREFAFASAKHIAHALEQKLLSRVFDRQRALGGRSPMQAALDHAVPLESPDGRGVEFVDTRIAVEELVALRLELARLSELALRLTDDQRLVLACQVSLGMGCAEFCARFDWTAEKYRKVAQRARARLKLLMGETSPAGSERRTSELAVPVGACVSEKYAEAHL
ncbi:MAG TPA: hypothetical protein VLJ42_06495 [Solirubrobacteraceae bacterium]|nr:hypothetical protein [Solirubrobacteraceae bacterium]